LLGKKSRRQALLRSQLVPAITILYAEELGVFFCETEPSQWSVPALLRQPLDGVTAEFCVLVTNFLGGFVFCRIVKGLRCFEAVPKIYRNTLRRAAFNWLATPPAYNHSLPIE
jgi:hypothetical protein